MQKVQRSKLMTLTCGMFKEAYNLNKCSIVVNKYVFHIISYQQSRQLLVVMKSYYVKTLPNVPSWAILVSIYVFYLFMSFINCMCLIPKSKAATANCKFLVNTHHFIVPILVLFNFLIISYYRRFLQWWFALVTFSNTNIPPRLQLHDYPTNIYYKSYKNTFLTPKQSWGEPVI